jgi:hypothetical protein
MCIISYQLCYSALCITWTDTQNSFTVFCNGWALKGNWLRGTLVTVDTRQNVPTSWPKKELVITSMIAGFCYSASEFIALLGCYAAQISSYWCFSTTVSLFNGQAVQAWPSDLGLHISTDLTSWTVKNKTYTYNYVLFLQTRQLGQSGTIDWYMAWCC